MSVCNHGSVALCPGAGPGWGAGACAAAGRLGQCQAGNPSRRTTIALGWGIPSCGKGHGQTAGDRPSSFHCAFVRCQAAGTGCARYPEQRLEAGCIQLTPATSARWEERSPLFGNSSYSHKTTRGASARARAGVRYKSHFAQKGTRPPRRSPRAVRGGSRQDTGRAPPFCAALSVWPGMKSQHGDVRPAEPAPRAGHGRCARRGLPGRPGPAASLWSQLTRRLSAIPGPGSLLPRGGTAADVAGVTPTPSASITPLPYRQFPTGRRFFFPQSNPEVPRLCHCPRVSRPAGIRTPRSLGG